MQVFAVNATFKCRTLIWSTSAIFKANEIKQKIFLAEW